MSSMGVLSRLLLLALVAGLALAAPASAEGEQSGDGGCAGGSDCGPSSSPDNSTAPPSDNSTSPNRPHVTVVTGSSSCDVVSPTGDKPYVSVNPVMGVLTVNLGCALRWANTSANALTPRPGQIPHPH
ncbi:MAG: hypothetical protein ABR562_01700 [Thermoplasmatota archaeon]|nr:hypothetical protein [Halobacteriales archaeon]